MHSGYLFMLCSPQPIRSKIIVLEPQPVLGSKIRVGALADSLNYVEIKILGLEKTFQQWTKQWYLFIKNSYPVHEDAIGAFIQGLRRPTRVCQSEFDLWPIPIPDPQGSKRTILL